MISTKDVMDAHRRIEPMIHRIPLQYSTTFSAMTGAEVYLKLENQQKTGSFKVRGASNKILKLRTKASVSSVIASSAGNHAQGVAFAAEKAGMEATIFMPRNASLAKIAATKGYGAEVRLFGDSYDEAYEAASEYATKEDSLFVHPFDDVDVIAGQATIGLEILAELSEAEVILVPAGGGGLLAGIASYCKQVNPAVTIIGVQAAGAPFIASRLRQTTHEGAMKTIADGIAVRHPGKITMPLIEAYVDDTILVKDNQIAEAMLLLLERAKQVVEPAGAVTLAAALQSGSKLRGKKTVLILSGGNIDVSFIHKIVERGLITRGRLVKFYTFVPDVPGILEKFAGAMGRANANILSLQHDRARRDLEINHTVIHCTCEVSSSSHAELLYQTLKTQGFSVYAER